MEGEVTGDTAHLITTEGDSAGQFTTRIKI